MTKEDKKKKEYTDWVEKSFTEHEGKEEKKGGETLKKSDIAEFIQFNVRLVIGQLGRDKWGGIGTLEKEESTSKEKKVQDIVRKSPRCTVNEWKGLETSDKGERTLKSNTDRQYHGSGGDE